MVGHVYCCAFAYADDIGLTLALVPPTTHALKATCDIIIFFINYAHEYDFQFNTAKCQPIKMANSIMYLFISMAS